MRFIDAAIDLKGNHKIPRYTRMINEHYHVWRNQMVSFTRSILWDWIV